jgi:hypothetical protein
MPLGAHDSDHLVDEIDHATMLGVQLLMANSEVLAPGE